MEGLVNTKFPKVINLERIGDNVGFFKNEIFDLFYNFTYSITRNVDFLSYLLLGAAGKVELEDFFRLCGPP